MTFNKLIFVIGKKLLVNFIQKFQILQIERKIIMNFYQK